MPFLEGVPCSIHGFVLPDGTAAFRPVEIVTLRHPAERRFLYAGLGTYWDPPAGDREEMRAVAAAVGRVLAHRHGYRGAFGVDGVLTRLRCGPVAKGGREGTWVVGCVAAAEARFASDLARRSGRVSEATPSAVSGTRLAIGHSQGPRLGRDQPRSRHREVT